jgi:hypothetical protein
MDMVAVANGALPQIGHGLTGAMDTGREVRLDVLRFHRAYFADTESLAS